MECGRTPKPYSLHIPYQSGPVRRAGLRSWRKLGDLVHSILQQQFRNCCVVPNGVLCSSLELSTKRKRAPN